MIRRQNTQLFRPCDLVRLSSPVAALHKDFWLHRPVPPPIDRAAHSLSAPGRDVPGQGGPAGRTEFTRRCDGRTDNKFARSPLGSSTISCPGRVVAAALRRFTSSTSSFSCCATFAWPLRASCAAACMAIARKSASMPSKWLFSRAIMWRAELMTSFQADFHPRLRPRWVPTMVPAKGSTRFVVIPQKGEGPTGRVRLF